MTLILAIIIVFIAVLGLGVSVFFFKNRAFPETHVGHNKEMQKCGLTCARCEDMGGCEVNFKSKNVIDEEGRFY